MVPLLPSPCLKFAHRGYHAHCAENTLESFAAAVTVGFDGIETDVRPSSEGEAVLFHNRVAPNGIPVAAQSRAQLSRACGYPVPTLAEALDAFPAIRWNIEIKTPAGGRLAWPVLQAYRQQHPLHAQDLLVTSFYHDVVHEAVGILPETDCGLLLAQRPLFDEAVPGTLTPLLAPCQRHPRLRTLVWDFEIADPALLCLAQAAGFRNAIYGAHTHEEHRSLERLLFAIISDHPQQLGLPETPPPTLHAA